MGAFEIIYLISTVLQVYAIYRFMIAFHREEGREVSLEGLPYLVYYGLVTGVFLVFRNPIFTILVNLSMLLWISWRYSHSLKKTITSSLLIYVIMILVEAVFGMMMVRDMQLSTLSELSDYVNALGVVVINIANYAIVLAISKLMSVRQGINIPLWYWLLLMFIPTSTIYMLLLVYEYSSFGKAQVIAVGGLLLMINFVVFYLYDVMSRYFEVKLKETSLIQLNKSYARQFEMMEKSNASIRAFRHDHKKHMNTLKDLMVAGAYDQARTYLASLTNHHNQEKIISKTGNIVIDSIINYELSRAHALGIEVTLQHNYLPMALELEDYDMTIVLSNLLSNALEGTQSFGQNKAIQLNLNYNKGVFYVKVANTFDGVVELNKGVLASRKKNKESHGIGLTNVRSTLEKYDGSLRVSYDEGWFTAESVMYVKAIKAVVTSGA